MNRRKAIGRIFAIGAVGAGAFAGYKWWDWHKSPDYAYLDSHRRTIAAMAQTILPADGTPGAIECGVPEYIILSIHDNADHMTANKFIDGLKDVDHHCHSKYDRPYEACTPAQQVDVLTHFEKKGMPMNGVAGKVQERFLGKSFFLLLKEYAVKGYCTSEAGMTRALAYVPVPGSYHGCIPLRPGQPVWATK